MIATAQTTFLYIIELKIKDLKFYKVGISTSPKERLRGIATSCPYPPKLVMIKPVDEPRKVEAKCHKLLSSSNTHGEWFDATLEEVKDAIKLAVERTTGSETTLFDVKISGCPTTARTEVRFLPHKGRPRKSCPLKATSQGVQRIRDCKFTKTNKTKTFSRLNKKELIEELIKIEGVQG